jgi:hypothetical protein
MKDRYLEASLSFGYDPPDRVVFVDKITDRYVERSVFGHNAPSSPTSPFKGKNAEECTNLLKRLWEETGSRVDYDHFVVLDERSLVENTAVLVQSKGDGKISVIRAEFNIATPRVLLYFIGDAGVDEDLEDLPDPDDDVLRIQGGPEDGSAYKDRRV